MTVNGLMVTVVGWAATTPREVVGEGVPFTSFRVATTPRYFDGRKGGWADGRTEWITVKAFRDAAFNVAASISKSDPVVIHGRLQTDEWVGENGPRITLVLEAHAIGHDLTRGTAKFARRIRVGAEQPGSDEQQGSGERPGTGEPTPDEVDPWASDAPAGAPDASAEQTVGQDQAVPTP